MEDESHGSTRKDPDELRERATRMTVELRHYRATRNDAIQRVAEQLGMHPETLRRWVRRAEIDGVRPGATTSDAQRLAELEREVRELRRANHILKTPAAFFAAELDCPTTKVVATSTSIATTWSMGVRSGRADLRGVEGRGRADRPEQLHAGKTGPPSARGIPREKTAGPPSVTVLRPSGLRTW